MGTIALWRFDEPDNAPALDAMGAVAPLMHDVADGLDYPPHDPGFVGQALLVQDGTGLVGQDATSGASLLQRDCSVQAIIAVDTDGICALNVSKVGTVYARGKGTGAAEYVGLAMQLHVLDQANHVVELRAMWQDSAGNVKVQVGGHFRCEDPGRFLLLTITRRWVDATHVVVRYYLGPILLCEVNSSDGDIGGGATGTTTVGVRWRAGFGWDEWIGNCSLDELRLCDHEMSAEEIEATYVRLAELQPEGYRQILAAQPEGFPATLDPASRVQGDLRQLGYAIGYADAQIENVRRNLMPDRAFDPVLAQWERITKQSPRPTDSIDQRRARIVAHLRQHAGVSPPGVEAALGDILDVTDPSVLQQLAFDNTVRDNFDVGVLQPERWSYNVVTPASTTWDVTGGMLRVRVNAGSAPTWDGNTMQEASALLDAQAPRAGLVGVQPPNTYGLDLFAEVDPSNGFPDGSEAGVWMLDWIDKGAFFLGVRRVGAAYQIGYQRYVNHAQIEAWHVLAASALVPHWFYFRQKAGTIDTWTVAYSTTGPTSGFTEVGNLVWSYTQYPTRFGVYHRATAALGAGSDVRFDSIAARCRHGSRPFYWYVFRDPALAGSPDLLGARGVARRMKQAQTSCDVIASKSLLCDDAGSVCDGGPMGGL